VGEGTVLRVSGDVYALEDGEGATVHESDGDEIARLAWPEPLSGLRHHAGTVTVWDGAGRVLVVDVARRRLLARLRATR
jgi:hypothetical protein